MWSILIAARKGHAEAAPPRSQPASAAESEPESRRALSPGTLDVGTGPSVYGNGHAPCRDSVPGAEDAVRTDETAMVRVYLHPGRSYLGSMDRLRAAEQFDFGDSREFETVGEAESACNGRAGFLVESAADGDSMLRGRVRFAQRLRD